MSPPPHAADCEAARAAAMRPRRRAGREVAWKTKRTGGLLMRKAMPQILGVVIRKLDAGPTQFR